MGKDPVIEWYERYILPGRRPPMSEWISKGNAPPGFYASQYAGWIRANPDRNKTRYYDGFDGHTYPGALAPRNPHIGMGRGRGR